ncbi:MAG: cysteine desulfurase NifS [Elusimicrobia bacterium GWA2_56_46]|nr:MAG: cysteine desulfurase NifS [Elusimicrobia bacterium GWA2_56_46]OGR55941.1 MAG: cysteine desulfurase NifS [Elusimicrobia bacterium GWC2_56_31]HBW22121.1 cysteine desulfurase NifS [Elusimicrobiota bacterium]
MENERVVYLDNNATTRVAPEVAEVMGPFYTELYGNPSSMHFFGGGVQKHLDEARRKVGELIGAAPEEIIFTSCGTESDSTAIWSALRAYPDKKHIVTTRVEHPGVLNVCKFLETQGYRITYLPVDPEGRLNLEDLKLAVTPETALVSIMWANNETGVIFPVEEAARIVHAKGALFHTDAVQAAGKIPINLRDAKIDMLSLSGHKLHAPKGIGVLYVKKGARFSPFLMGGHQERGRRAGTENVPYIVGLGKAAELALKNMERENAQVKALRDRLQEGLLKTIPNVRVNGGGAERLPNTANISFEYVEGESILIMLSEKGICASSGSACTSGSLEPSHVMAAMAVPQTYAHGSIRFSFSVYNTEAEVDFVLKEMPPIIERLRAISPFADGKPLFGMDACETHKH